MNEFTPKGWRFWLLIALLFLFPIVFHPWWLFVFSLAAYAFLVWLVLPSKEISK
jgi:hypothetical protein